MKLFVSIDDLVLRQNTNNCLITSVGFHKCLKGSVKLGEDESLEESCSKFIEGLLLGISTSEKNILYLVDEQACLSPVVANILTVVVSKVEEHLNFILLCGAGPLGHGVEF